MILFRLRRPHFSSFSLPTFILRKPLAIFFFIYLLFSSSDLLYLPLLLFKVKLTNILAVLLFCAFCASRAVRIPKAIFGFTIALLGSMALSVWNSPNLIASLGFIVFFLFNYVFYFLVPYNQFRFFQPDLLFKIYRCSFYCTGAYALCQILFSILGIALPGTTQYIGGLARGSALTYEPSFYALYMTPFAFYSTVRFLLQDRSVRRLKEVFWPNLLLLASTSTGCFFSYLFFLFFIILFQYFKIIQLSISQIVMKFSFSFLVGFTLLWFVQKQLIVTGLLKFFYSSGVSHFSVQDRWRGLVEYWGIFLDHPFTGVSFGGGPFYLAQKEGAGSVDLLNRAILIKYSPMNATTEILASVGILGALCFLYFLSLLARMFRSALRISALTDEERIQLIALALSICVMFMTLQFNQSIMRAYMWIHIGFFCGYMRHLQGKYSLSRSRLGSDQPSSEKKEKLPLLKQDRIEIATPDK